MSTQPKVFLITGTSTGLGYHYVERVLAEGHNVIATSRNAATLPTFKGSQDAASSRFLAISLDVTDPNHVEDVFSTALAKFGHIDVVVNNAGHGTCGVVESFTDEQIHDQMQVNFFGVVNVTRTAVRIMRESKRGGIIQQCSSVAGQCGVPGFAFYCASKFALEGFTESIAQEMKPEWNIHFTSLCLGGYATSWYDDKNLLFGADQGKVYDHLDSKTFVKERGACTPGDPVKAVQRMFLLALMEKPPLRVVLGSDAHAQMDIKMEHDAQERKKWQYLTLSTDFDSQDEVVRAAL